MYVKVIFAMVLFALICVAADVGLYHCADDESRLWTLGLDSCALGIFFVAFLVQLSKGRARGTN